MPLFSDDGSERKTDRLEAFSDAVLAIAITLPLVALEAPEVPVGGDLAAAYVALVPGYISYALDFLVIGLYWAHSHFSGKIIRKTDHRLNLLTVLFLASVSITPFPSTPFIEHLFDAANNRTAALVYGGILTGPAVLWFLRLVYASRHGLLDPHLKPSYVHGLLTRSGWSAGLSVAGLALAIVGSWQLGLAVVGLVIIAYLAPPSAPQFKPGEEPAHDLEEADERVD